MISTVNTSSDVPVYIIIANINSLNNKNTESSTIDNNHFFSMFVTFSYIIIILLRLTHFSLISHHWGDVNKNAGFVGLISAVYIEYGMEIAREYVIDKE